MLSEVEEDRVWKAPVVLEMHHPFRWEHSTLYGAQDTQEYIRFNQYLNANFPVEMEESYAKLRNYQDCERVRMTEVVLRDRLINPMARGRPQNGYSFTIYADDVSLEELRYFRDRQAESEMADRMLFDGLDRRSKILTRRKACLINILQYIHAFSVFCGQQISVNRSGRTPRAVG